MSAKGLLFCSIVIFIFFSKSAHALCVLGIGSCETALITGNYVMTGDPNVTLRIDSSKITAQGGPMSISANYVIKSVERDKLLLEVSAPGAGKGEMIVFIKKGEILIRDSFAFGGDWTKR